MKVILQYHVNWSLYLYQGHLHYTKLMLKLKKKVTVMWNDMFSLELKFVYRVTVSVSKHLARI